MTLVEVVAGIVLLSTLLVMILMSHRNHSAQIRRAKVRMKAIRAADELLSTWMASASFPRAGQRDALPGTPGWYWQIVSVPASNDLASLRASAIRLEIVDGSNLSENCLLTSVELMVPSQGSTIR
jgi:type II secretory pathway pseudopilin PulG